MKTRILLGVFLVWALARTAVAGGPEGVERLLTEARSLKSYHYKVSGAGIMEPHDSGFIVRTKMVNKSQLWAKRVKGKMLLCETGRLELIAVEHPEVINVVSNVFVFDGQDNYMVTYQEGTTLAERLHDPKRTCRLFTDAETLLVELKKDRRAKYLGRQQVNDVRCRVYGTSAQFFVHAMMATAGSVEIAIDEKNGLPVRLFLKSEASTNTIVFEQTEVNVEIKDDRFRSPPGLEYQSVEPDGLGGWHHRLD